MISSSGPQCQHCCNIQIKPYVELFVSQIGWRIVLLRYFNCNTIVCDSHCNLLMNEELRIISADSGTSISIAHL